MTEAMAAAGTAVVVISWWEQSDLLPEAALPLQDPTKPIPDPQDHSLTTTVSPRALGLILIHCAVLNMRVNSPRRALGMLGFLFSPSLAMQNNNFFSGFVLFNIFDGLLRWCNAVSCLLGPHHYPTAPHCPTPEKLVFQGWDFGNNFKFLVTLSFPLSV